MSSAENTQPGGMTLVLVLALLLLVWGTGAFVEIPGTVSLVTLAGLACIVGILTT